MAAWGVRRDPQALRSVREKPRVSAGPVPSGKGDTRPIVLGLGRKTRDQTGPTRTRGSRERTPLPGRASGPRASPPRSRPSPVPLPHPYGRGKQATLLPKPHARKRLTRLRTSHFVPSTSAKGPQRLLLPPATRCRPTPPRPYRHLRAAPLSFGPAPPPPPIAPSVPSLHQPRAGAELPPPPPLPPPPHADRRCIERPGLCQVVAPPPLVGLHTKRLRRSRRRRRRRPPRSGAGAGGAEEEQPPRGETRG